MHSDDYRFEIARWSPNRLIEWVIFACSEWLMVVVLLRDHMGLYPEENAFPVEPIFRPPTPGRRAQPYSVGSILAVPVVPVVPRVRSSLGSKFGVEPVILHRALQCQQHYHFGESDGSLAKTRDRHSLGRRARYFAGCFSLRTRWRPVDFTKTEDFCTDRQVGCH